MLPEVVKIDIDDAARIYWNGESLADRAALEARVRSAAAQQVQPEIHLRPDKAVEVRHRRRSDGVRAAAGLTKIGIVGSEQFIE